MTGLNHTYRLIWSDVAGVFVAVAEIARVRGKRASSAVLIAAALSVLGLSAQAANLPTGGQITAGAGTISQSGNTLTITRQAPRWPPTGRAFPLTRATG
ncbi:hypothetical protein GWK36_11685 [Caldichromatium japonicum]|uniref:ESPR domain-containing protein n=1 Tax=Caldichromatium japonicum TaxID=2699430 RepID=A0A6G7VF89_9GAMM|nr:ESPR domain-containing protein [Caldichromatium japonicum]QIK38536.1 hypothetical protein GWK36_11685 [Caldichromatium japonicum]